MDSKVFFTDAPKGTNNVSRNTSNLEFPRSEFNGRVYLRNDYSNNRIFDDISDGFTGIGATHNMSVSGVNTTGIQTGSTVVLLNGIFQKPTTANNSGNNYDFVGVGTTATNILFTGISSANGEKIVSQHDVNLNQLPRGGVIVSLGSTGGQGIAPLVGAAVTVVINGSGTITSIGAGSTDKHGSGYRGNVAIGVTDDTGNGSGANVTATVGAGGTLAFTVVSGGTGYVKPKLNIPDPSYEALEVTGISRLGIGATTDTGQGLKVTVDISANPTTGIGSTLFTVSSFKVARNGFGFKKGDKIKPVGLVTARGAVLTDFELTVNEIFTDEFASWDFGEFDYTDPIKTLQDGVRTRFPIQLNSQLLSFEIDRNSADSSLIDMKNLLLIFVNGVIQHPGVDYDFEGGTTFNFTSPPDADDDVAIFFYKGTSGVDTIVVDVVESVKTGDVVDLTSNNAISGTIAQSSRTIVGITTSDTFETEIYTGVGIDEVNFKPLNWTKQKVDKIIGGNIISKSRDSIEPLIYPTARLIGDLSTGTAEGTSIFVDDAKFFDYEEDNSATSFQINDIGVLVVNDISPVAAALTATVSNTGQVAISVVSGGSGYVGSTTSISIAAPVGVAATQFAVAGVSTFAVATGNITSGIITSVTMNNVGFGYTNTNVPEVLAPTPNVIKESITNIKNVQGFSGIVTAIETVTVGVSTRGLRIGLKKESGNFNDLVAGYPIYIFDTHVGNGVTSLNASGVNTDTVGIGTSFADNVYIIQSITKNATVAEILVNVHSGDCWY